MTYGQSFKYNSYGQWTKQLPQSMTAIGLEYLNLKEKVNVH